MLSLLIFTVGGKEGCTVERTLDFSSSVRYPQEESLILPSAKHVQRSREVKDNSFEMLPTN